jgi:hypothetical protein
MSRGLLGKKLLKEIAKQLPDIKQLNRDILSYTPELVSFRFPSDSTIPVASVCLHDAFYMLADARYAFHEILAHRAWYLEKRETPSERTAIHFTRFYADDVALRLYAAGEHLANAIIDMLEIKKQNLVMYKKKRISRQIIVWEYLKREESMHVITQAVKKLAHSKEWVATLNYRNDWVHGKPPIIKGLGIQYERRKRWEISDKHIGLSFGGGDKPRYSDKELINMVKPALFVFVEVLTDITAWYVQLVENRSNVLGSFGEIT